MHIPKPEQTHTDKIKSKIYVYTHTHQTLAQWPLYYKWLLVKINSQTCGCEPYLESMQISSQCFSGFRTIGSLELAHYGMWSEQMSVGGLLMQGFSETVDPVGFTCLGSQTTLCEFSQICERKALVKQRYSSLYCCGKRHYRSKFKQ